MHIWRVQCIAGKLICTLTNTPGQMHTHMARNIPGNDILQSVRDISALFVGKHKHRGLDSGVAPHSFDSQLCVDLYEQPFSCFSIHYTQQRANAKDTTTTAPSATTTVPRMLLLN